ncbi:MAG: metal ABC transporter ATP-binding protein [Thermoleophilia bacterium]|nr:metal ABC transporter ATP-binding protein [Thermoleophilia bacterium]
MHGSRELNALIEARGAALAYPGAEEPALRGLDLTLSAGQLVILLGPNGGGKTTLFRGLMGELAPTVGSLRVTAPVAYLPQHDLSRTDFPVTALDVVLMGTLGERRPWQRPGRAERQRAHETLERVGLAERAGASFGELSGGQRRRVLLARTIVQRAPVILLDEPLAGVDPASAQAIDEVLRGLRDEGRLVLVASHDIEQAKRADRVLCLNGRLIAAGTPGAVLTEATLRATYAAELTLLPATGDADTLGGLGAVGVVEHHHHH